MAVSVTATDELIALGLGSCIGLAIVDRTAGVAGLAHVVLPESHGENVPQPGKFADTAVPALLARMRRAGAMDRRMEVALVGGARMFEISGGLDIGARNEQAVIDALRRQRLTPKVTATGGNQGRTVKVAAGAGTVTLRVAGQAPVTLIEGRAGAPGAGEPPGRSATRIASGARGHTGARVGRAVGGPRGRSALRTGGPS